MFLFYSNFTEFSFAKGAIDIKLELVQGQVMTWHWAGYKPLPEQLWGGGY